MEYVIQLDLKPLYILCFACCDKDHAYAYSKINVANNFAGTSYNHFILMKNPLALIKLVQIFSVFAL